MGVVVASATAVSTAANTKSSDQVSGTYQFLPFPALVNVYARGSATGMNISLIIDGQNVIDDKAVPYTGTAGAISKQDHLMGSFPAGAGSRVEFYLRNTTAGALTTDHLLEAEPLA